MSRVPLLAVALALAGPAFAEPVRPTGKNDPAALIDPVSLKVNEAAAKRLEAERKARDLAYDLKMRRTMAGVCRGC